MVDIDGKFYRMINFFCIRKFFLALNKVKIRKENPKTSQLIIFYVFCIIFDHFFEITFNIKNNIDQLRSDPIYT